MLTGMPTSAAVNAGDTAWVLISAALVMLMIPGHALFYGGMVRVKSALNMLMMSVTCLAVVTVVWVLYGYSLAFGPDAGGVIGTLRDAGFAGIGTHTVTGSIPTLAFAAFQLMFAAITAALKEKNPKNPVTLEVSRLVGAYTAQLRDFARQNGNRLPASLRVNTKVAIEKVAFQITAEAIKHAVKNAKKQA